MMWLLPSLRERMEENGMQGLFPVQEAAIPHVVAASAAALPRDVCICSPTGSGKTLAYVLPVVQTLVGLAGRQMRCVTILPTRDLASQVFEVFEEFCRGTCLRVRLIGGWRPFGKEQKRIMRQTVAPDGTRVSMSNVDVLVATPGRLADHLKWTEGFSLRYLRFLVADEADLLLGEEYQSWTRVVRAAMLRTEPTSLPHRRALRILCSATLTPALAGLSALDLCTPTFISLPGADGPYALPESLHEYAVKCRDADRPLGIIHLLTKLQCPCLVFGGSLDTTHRLSRLLELWGFDVAEHSAMLSQPARARTVAHIYSGAVSVVVCSDAMSRGMDIPRVDAVLNYEKPPSLELYIHRVGRTARAGQAGRCYTLLEEDEEPEFDEMRKKASGGRPLMQYALPPSALTELEGRFQSCLLALKDVMKLERGRRLLSSQPLGDMAARLMSAAPGGDNECLGRKRQREA